MAKNFGELSTRQQNRRLKAYAQWERQIIEGSLNRPTVIIGDSLNEPVMEEDVPMCSHKDLNVLSPDFWHDDNSAPRDLQDNEGWEDITHESTQLSTWLRSWTIRHRISKKALSELLIQLRSCGHNDLPADARTLLKTPRRTPVEALGEHGTFFHYGLEKALVEQLTRTNLIIENGVILIDVNIDGLPISKSSKSQIWPILGKIYTDEPFEPFVISAFHGRTKPPCLNTFLERFCDEYKNLHLTGFTHREQKYIVQIRSVICDSPARAFVTCTKAHNGYFGCGKCMQEGTYSERHMLFLEYNAPLRTDDNFKNRLQDDHHTGVSPFETVELPMVSTFPLDYMHVVCLGVMKKLLGLWLNGYHTARLSARKATELSVVLTETAAWVPKEFARKPRALDELSRWKATEFREFLLYLGPVVLHDILPDDNVAHFNGLNCAMRILSDPKDCHRNIAYSKELVQQFVQICEDLYGKDTIIYNVHNLIHLHQDVQKFGPLHNFSAFPFENYLQEIKKMLRKAEKPLQQLYLRIVEKAYVPVQSQPEKCNTPTLKKEIVTLLPMNCTHAFAQVRFNGFVLTNKKPNNCCFMRDKTVAIIEHICHDEKGTAVVIGRKFLTKKNLPLYPCDSRNMSIYIVQNLSDRIMWPIADITNKAVQLPFKQHSMWCCMPLLHSIK